MLSAVLVVSILASAATASLERPVHKLAHRAEPATVTVTNTHTITACGAGCPADVQTRYITDACSGGGGGFRVETSAAPAPPAPVASSENPGPPPGIFTPAPVNSKNTSTVFTPAGGEDEGCPDSGVGAACETTRTAERTFAAVPTPSTSAPSANNPCPPGGCQNITSRGASNPISLFSGVVMALAVIALI